MQTLLMFGGDRFYPKGGADDLLGVVPYISEELVFGVMRDYIAKYFDNQAGSYWCNILVVQEGTPGEQRRWRYEYSADPCSVDADEAVVRSEKVGELTATLIRRPDWDKKPEVAI